MIQKFKVLMVMAIFSMYFVSGSAWTQNGFRTGQYDGQSSSQYDGRANHRDGVGPSDAASGVSRGGLGTPGFPGASRYGDAYIDNNSAAAVDPSNCGAATRSYDRASGAFIGYGDLRPGCR